MLLLAIVVDAVSIGNVMPLLLEKLLLLVIMMVVELIGVEVMRPVESIVLLQFLLLDNGDGGRVLVEECDVVVDDAVRMLVMLLFFSFGLRNCIGTF